MSSRIIGGRYVDSGEYPSIVSIQRNAGAATCGGTIINSLLVLTACHCIVLYNERKEVITMRKWKSVRLVAGSVSRFFPLDPDAQVRFVFRWTRHPRCHRDTAGDWEYDFATVIPTQKFIFNDYVAPGKLIGDGDIIQAHKTTDSSIKSKIVCVVLGWGAQKFDAFSSTKGENDSQYLKLAEIELVLDSLCSTYYCYKPGGCHNVRDYVKNKGQFCGKGVSRRESPCVGDSGGPLFCHEHLFGVVSYGTACSQYDHPLIYGRVDMAFDFFLNLTMAFSTSTASSIVPSLTRFSIIKLSLVRLKW